MKGNNKHRLFLFLIIFLLLSSNFLVVFAIDNTDIDEDSNYQEILSIDSGEGDRFQIKF